MKIQDTIRELIVPQAVPLLWQGWEMGMPTASYSEGAVYDIYTNDEDHARHASAIISAFPANDSYPSARAEKEALDRLQTLAAQEGHVPDGLRSCRGILRPAERLSGMYSHDGRTAGSWSIIRTEKVEPISHHLQTHRIDAASIVAQMVELAQTLEEMHEAGIIHGTLRMERLFVAEDGTMRIGGVAYAKHYDPKTIASGLGARDVYQLCTAMRWMVDRVEVPDRILEILLKRTSATPSERYQTAQALRTDLEKVAAAMVPAEGNAVRPKRPVWIAVVIAAVLLITLLTQCGRGKRTAPTTSTETVPIVAETVSTEAEDDGAADVVSTEVAAETPAGSVPMSGIAQVTVTSCHIRSAPNKDDPDNILTIMYRGSYVCLTAKADDWYAVNYAGGTGYIHSSMLTVEDCSPKAGHVTATDCDLRSTPDHQSSSNIKQTLPEGTSFTSYAYNGDWFFVGLADGTLGFVSDTAAVLDE